MAASAEPMVRIHLPPAANPLRTHWQYRRVHHSDKSEDNYQGSTAIAATFEVTLGIRGRKTLADWRYSAGFLIKADKFRARRDDTMIGGPS
jgi:hypothetical protein